MNLLGSRIAYNYPTMERLERERGVGLCLLPIELLYAIFSRLALPELLRLRAACRALHSLPLLPGELHAAGGSWLFLFKKLSPRHAVLRGFNDRAGRWFLFPLTHVFPSAAAAGDDLYLLAAAGDFFLFASNARRELIAADLRSGAARRLPASPLGPRGTSSWRRPGLKLLSSSSTHFRFLFTEITQAGPTLFDYTSENDSWKTWGPSSSSSPPYEALLSATHQGAESVLVAAPPFVLRPRFPVGAGDGMRVYGDGHLAVIRSAAAEEAQRLRAKRVVGIDIWGVSSDGGWWEKIAGAPPELVEMVGGRSFSVMTGCLEVAKNMARLVLMADYKGTWDLKWVTFDKGSGSWGVVPVPDCGAKGFNMAGMALTSSLGLWPAAPPKETAALASL